MKSMSNKSNTKTARQNSIKLTARHTHKHNNRLLQQQNPISLQSHNDNTYTVQ